jgi:pimeloyl-ACP methyl ester carboxylesterase
LAQGEDLVFVDQRGTGMNPDLHCAAEAQQYGTPGDMWPARGASACAARLAKTVDLTHYTTTDTVRDLDEVRAALSIAQIDLIAYSYGTRVAQEYLRQHGNAVRAALLIGPEAPSQAVPGGLARQAEQSLQQVLHNCQTDNACAAAYPDLSGDLARLGHLLDNGGSQTDSAGTHRASRGIVASYLRTLTYSAEGASELPRVLHALANGDLDGKAGQSIANWQHGLLDGEPWGQYLSVTCAEDVPYVDPVAERTQAGGTLLGSYRLDQQMAACKDWPRSRISPTFHTAVATDVPVLALVGEFDPATPVSKSAEIVAGMSKGRLLVVPNRGHGMSEGRADEWEPCFKKLTDEFFATADAMALDTRCIGKLTLPPFKIAG